jgi:hypothetical protein
MRHDSGVRPRFHPTPARKPHLRGLAALALPLLISACASAPADPDAALTDDVGVSGDGAGCRALIGRYVDAAQTQSAEGRWIDATRPEGLTQILGLDPDTGASVPLDERAVEILHVAGDRYSLSLGKMTVPDAVSLWDTPARCVGSALQLQTASRYESSDGVHVTRQKMRVTLVGEEDALVLRRALSERAIGLLDLRPGAGNVERYRFPRFEGRPANR